MSEAPKKVLRAIGFWRDPASGDHRFRHPIAFVDPEWDLAERRLVAQYLDSGERAVDWMGLSWCRFHCGIEEPEMGASDFSDGVWLWPEGLTHYVLEHAVRLPDEFIHHVRHEAEHPGRESQVDEENLNWNHDFWVDWCNEHANPESGYREIEESERRAVLQKRREEVPRLVEEFGLGTEECSEPGCEQRTLGNMDRCAWHVAGGDS